MTIRPISPTARRLQAFARQAQYTHAAARSDGLTLFTLDHCECCNAIAAGANAVGVAGMRTSHATEAGLIVLDAVPGELGHCEALGLAVCTDCYTDAVTAPAAPTPAACPYGCESFVDTDSKCHVCARRGEALTDELLAMMI